MTDFFFKSTIHSVQCVLRREASRSKLPRERKRSPEKEEMRKARWRCKGTKSHGWGERCMMRENGPLHLLPQREAPPPESRVTSHGHLLRLAVACDGVLCRWDFAETKGNQLTHAKRHLYTEQIYLRYKIFLDSLTMVVSLFDSVQAHLESFSLIIAKTKNSILINTSTQKIKYW